MLSRNDERIANTLLRAINPIKQSYKNFTQNLEDKSHSYIFQKESIEKLSQENLVLRKRLLEQMHYIQQVKNIYKILPQLTHLPLSTVSIVQTISYIKLNSFSQIILTKPKGLRENKLYGLIQKGVVAGIARVKNNQLHGYLTSDEKCRFSVFIGHNNAPGIAIGFKKQEMLIKFIPKWHNIKKNDKVFTSGLDNIFYANIFVGIITKVEVQSSYTVAHIQTYNDISHPKTFFLINNAKATLCEGFDRYKINTSIEKKSPAKIEDNSTSLVVPKDTNRTQPLISSIPKRIDQTQNDLIEPESPEEDIRKVKTKKPSHKKFKIKKPSHKKRITLDLF
ncbi:Rod shape-determining protein MreC [hydrothermal vent metagenome]|uniref:Cell shape-determining protein MreC n=1 Tax=hydrothermal vent metagenome TaxID=652676 RepID=A0A1W1CQW8_9ZZZZ